MEPEITQQDRDFLMLAIHSAEETFRKDGNYPVGAVLVIDGQLVEAVGNRINQYKSRVHHAENQLIINHAPELLTAYKKNKSIDLYSTLEPCIQCLGAAVINQVSRIIYIQKDPNGGACDLLHDNIGLFYREQWPLILHAPISDKPLQLLRAYFDAQIEAGNTQFPTKMLALLEQYS